MQTSTAAQSPAYTATAAHHRADRAFGHHRSVYILRWSIRERGVQDENSRSHTHAEELQGPDAEERKPIQTVNDWELRLCHPKLLSGIFFRSLE